MTVEATVHVDAGQPDADVQVPPATIHHECETTTPEVADEPHPSVEPDLEPRQPVRDGRLSPQPTLAPPARETLVEPLKTEHVESS